MKKRLLTPFIAGLTFGVQANTIEKIGDITQILNPIAAAGLTYYYDDEEGRWQFIKSFVTSQTISHVTKFAADKTRPNFSAGSLGGTSFPSGHTSAAFGGASFIHSRYGATWGIPAYSIAAFTGYSRVYADKHYWDDVIAGASIATLSSLYFVDSVDDGVAFLPKTDGDGIGINLIFSSAFFEGNSTTKESDKPFNGRYKFEFFPGISQFDSTDPGNPIFGIDLTETDGRVVTSAVRWSMDINKKHQASVLWSPIELRGIGENINEGQFARYLSNDIRFAWNYKFNIADNFITHAGATLIAQYTESEVYIKNPERTTVEDSKEWSFYPALSATLGYQFTPKTSFIVSGTYGDAGHGDVQDYLAQLSYTFNQRWDAGIGYSQYERNQSDSETFKNVKFDVYFLNVGYRF